MENIWSGIFVGSATLLAWAATQAQARTRSVRRELRFRREEALVKDQYIFRLERSHVLNGMELPDHPKGWDELEKEREHELW